MLREDNADQRLTPAGHELGLVGEQRWSRFAHKQDAIEAETRRLEKILLRPEELDPADCDRLDLKREAHALEVLRRPEVGYADLAALPQVGPGTADSEVNEQVEIRTKYAGYIERQQLEIERQRRHEETQLPDDFDYAGVRGLSNEVRQKLQSARPETLGQAARLSGVTPAAVSLLLVHLKKHGRLRQSA